MNANTAAHVLGIDFGTSKSTMSWFNPRSGQAEIIKNTQGEEKTPSVVYFGPDGLLVGTPAENMLEDEDERLRVFASVKRFLGSSMQFALPDGQQVTPLDMTTAILQKLKQDAETGHFHETINSVVLTCPASFTEQERSILKSAAEKAGFQTVELLEEPVAAALAYGHAGFKCGDNLLVYDLGGGTFDLAVLTRDKRTFRLALEPRGLRCCGGDDFDRAIYDHFDRMARESLQRTISGSESYDLQFLRLCRQRKESLSDRDRCEFSTYLTGGVRFKHSLERSHFESLIEANVKETIQLTRSVVEDAKQNRHEVQTVVLIGGSSRVPLVQRLLSTAAKLPVEPQRWQQQDVAVALGAAYYGHSMRGKSNGARKKKQPAASKLDTLHRILGEQMAAVSANGDLTVPARTIATILFIEPKDDTALQTRLALVRPLLDQATKTAKAIEDREEQYLAYLNLSEIEADVGDAKSARRALKSARSALDAIITDWDGDNKREIYEGIFHEELSGTDKNRWLAWAFARLGDKENANHWFQAARAHIKALPEKFRDREYLELAEALVRAKYFDDADVTIAKIRNSAWRDDGYKMLAIEQATAGLSSAASTAQKVESDYYQQRLLEEILMLTLKRGDFAYVEETLAAIGDLTIVDAFWSSELHSLEKTSVEYLLHTLINWCNDLPQPLDEDTYSFLLRLYLHLAEQQIRFDDLNAAGKALKKGMAQLERRMPDRLPHAWIASLCARLNETQLSKSWFRDAQKRIDEVDDIPEMWLELWRLAEHKLIACDIRGAKATADRISDTSNDSRKWDALSSIAVVQAKAGDFRGARATAASIEDTSKVKWKTYYEIARAQALADDINGALTTARLIPESETHGLGHLHYEPVRSLAYCEILKAQIRNRDLRGAEKTMKAISGAIVSQSAYIIFAVSQICLGNQIAIQADEGWRRKDSSSKTRCYLRSVKNLISCDSVLESLPFEKWKLTRI